ncbi:PepSY-associated TM helix domain-containing protein [Alkalicoccobacillus porphyridii]|uniref:PepSY domain-containing protein n=1 Tax=Alkalicoccobacillus porphyridii TaxID=2597270 RepID=A0A554A214_9BACI|nr:PepSY domain-containing protein [Alkalicoccobacillus porphyridii]TSB47686.1 PepSY domain-containing protein [Alkalicoccobacillus porphyridii]
MKSTTNNKKQTRASFYQAVWRWHFYAGVIFAPFLFILAFSGSVYLFKPQIEAFLYQDYFVADQVAENRISYSAQRDQVKEAYPDASISSFVLQEDAEATTEFLISENGQAASVFVNPYTGDLQGKLDDDQRLMTIFKKIHSELLIAGTIGNRIVELAACWAIVLLVTGLYIWWPRSQASIWGTFLPRLRKKGRLFWRDMHAVPAFWLSLFILILIATGLPWSGVLGPQIQKLSTAPDYTYTWQERPESVTLSKDGADGIPWANENLVMPESTFESEYLPISIEDVTHIAEMEDMAYPYTLTLPDGPTGVYTISHETNRLDLSTKHIDQYSGTVLIGRSFQDFDLMPKLVSAGIALHEGRLFGWPNQLLGLITCLGLMGIVVSSLVMWKKRRSSGTFGAPPRSKDKKVTRVVFFIMLGFGILLPLVGISIIVIYLLDRFILSKLSLFSNTEEHTKRTG